MPSRREVVITGCRVVSPIGIGCEAFWSSLTSGRSGIGWLTAFDATGYPARLTSQVADFNPQDYVRPRKSLKVMSRDTQLGMTAADMACRSAGISGGTIDPDRYGVVFAADKMQRDARSRRRLSRQLCGRPIQLPAVEQSD